MRRRAAPRGGAGRIGRRGRRARRAGRDGAATFALLARQGHDLIVSDFDFAEAGPLTMAGRFLDQRFGVVDPPVEVAPRVPQGILRELAAVRRDVLAGRIRVPAG